MHFTCRLRAGKVISTPGWAIKFVPIPLAGVLVPLMILTSPSVMKESQPADPLDSWSQPQMLFEGEGWTQYNALAASPDGTVHAFWQSDPSKLTEGAFGDPGADNLWYSRITKSEISEPINILVPPSFAPFQKGIRAVVVPPDEIHLMLWSTSQCLQHAVVKEAVAIQPKKWMDSRSCMGQTRFRFGMTLEDRGGLHLAFASDGDVLFYTLRDPESGTWSQPTRLSEGKEGLVYADVRLAIDSTKGIHVVWSEYEAPNYYPPKGVYYARSSDQGKSWSSPRQLSGSGSVEPEIIVDGNDRIHVAWNGSVNVGNRYHRMSENGGLSWSPISSFNIPGGILGPPALAVDSANGLHAIMSSDHGLFTRFGIRLRVGLSSVKFGEMLNPEIQRR